MKKLLFLFLLLPIFGSSQLYYTKPSTAAGGGTDPVIRYFTTDSTWTKPANLYGVYVVCIGAGAGGGAGRRGGAGELRGAGGGGGSGVIVRRFIPADSLGATESVTVDAAGTGGSIAADNTDGGNGGAGGDVSFGTLVLAKGGTAGNGGTATAGGAASANQVITNQTPPQDNYIYGIITAYAGQLGSATGSTGSGASTTVFQTVSTGTIGGASGGGLNATNTQRAGGPGARLYNAANTQSAAVAGGTAGGGNGNAGTANYGDQLLMGYGEFTTTSGYGGSGSGGGSSATATSGNGGNGGNYGGGGGGGAASVNGQTGGNGGNGGAGLCIIMEIYGE